MESIIKGRLKDVDYPIVGNHFQQGRYEKLWLVADDRILVEAYFVSIIESHLHQEYENVSDSNGHADLYTPVSLEASTCFFMQDLHFDLLYCY